MSMATRTDTQSPALHAADSHDLIRVQGARVNNLKDVSVEIPSAGWQHSTVPVGALHHHADLQARRHYRGFGVLPDGRHHSGSSTTSSRKAATGEPPTTSSLTPASTQVALRC